MRVKLLKTNEIREFNTSYGSRLIEQGKAISVSEATLSLKDQRATAETEEAIHCEHASEKATRGAASESKDSDAAIGPKADLEARRASNLKKR